MSAVASQSCCSHGEEELALGASAGLSEAGDPPPTLEELEEIMKMLPEWLTKHMPLKFAADALYALSNDDDDSYWDALKNGMQFTLADGKTICRFRFCWQCVEKGVACVVGDTTTCGPCAGAKTGCSAGGTTPATGLTPEHQKWCEDKIRSINRRDTLYEPIRWQDFHKEYRDLNLGPVYMREIEETAKQKRRRRERERAPSSASPLPPSAPSRSSTSTSAPSTSASPLPASAASPPASPSPPSASTRSSTSAPPPSGSSRSLSPTASTSAPPTSGPSPPTTKRPRFLPYDQYCCPPQPTRADRDRLRAARQQMQKELAWLDRQIELADELVSDDEEG